MNQSRIVGLGLLPSDSLESQSYDFDENKHIKPSYGVERLHKSSFKPWRVFEKIDKVQNWPFLVIFVLILAMFLRSQSKDFDTIAHAGAPLGVEWLQNFMKIVRTIVVEKFKIFIERSGEKSTMA